MYIEDNVSLADKKVPEKYKVLFVGPYRQADSWGFLSRSVISSLLSIENIDLTTRPIFLAQSTTPSPPVGPDIFRCESNKQPNYDILIQHALPDFMISSGSFDLNIGIASFETKNNTQWDNHLRLLDKIFVSTEAEKECLSSNLQDKAHVIGGVISGIDASMRALLNRFSFYAFAGNMETKGGVISLLQAYLSEFHVNESVSLVLQSNSAQKTQELINAIVPSLGIYDSKYYPHIHIVEETPEDSIHKQCNCLIDASVTRGFKEEVAKALLYGNTPLILEGSGMEEYVDDSNGWVVKSSESILVCPDRPLANAFTARESCLIPDTPSLMKCMRDAFDNHISYIKKSSKGKSCGPSFTIEKQSALIKEALCQ